MNFTAAPLAGVYVIDMERIDDDRGFFARSFCAEEFVQQGLAATLRQCSVSFNGSRGTLRGLHYQAAPHEEEKLVRCTAGAIFDVVVDLRAGSPTYRRWYGTELTAGNHRALYIPKGCAHGFLTLADATEVYYMMSVCHAPGYGRGLRWNDPALAIDWPARPTVISDRDAGYALCDPSALP